MRIFRSLSIFTFILSVFTSVFTLHSFESERVDSILVSDIQKGLDDLSYVGNEIISASNSSLLTAGIVLGTSISLMPYDEDMRKTALRNR